MTFCIRRREFILGVGGAAVGPMVARAQRTVPLIVWLSANAANAVNYDLASFRQGLKEGGYEEGRNVEILYRYAEYQHDRLPSLAADLVRLRVAVIVAAGGAPALAAKAATATIPIVFVTGVDPVAMSFVPRENRPGRCSGRLLSRRCACWRRCGSNSACTTEPSSNALAAKTRPAN